jgi:hypothetical protein
MIPALPFALPFPTRPLLASADAAWLVWIPDSADLFRVERCPCFPQGRQLMVVEAPRGATKAQVLAAINQVAFHLAAIQEPA